MALRISPLTVLAVLSLLGANLVSAQLVDEILDQPQQRLEPTDAIDMGLGTAFGEAIAIDGNVMVVGAPHESHLGDREGAVYIFERYGAIWAQTQRIVAPDAAVRNQFGTAVDVSLGTQGISFIVVGAHLAGASGKVYTFKRESGGLFEYHDTLLLDEPTNAAEFGMAVGIDFFIPPNSQTGDPAFIIAAGAPSHRDLGPPPETLNGSVSIFQYVGGPPRWVLTHTFFGAQGAQLGTSIAVAGPFVVAGAIGAGDAGFLAGAAFLWAQGNQLPGGAFVYNFASRMEPAAPPVREEMGNSAAADWAAGSAAIGAEANAAEGAATGAVYIFELTTFGPVRTEYQMLQPDLVTGGDRFGASVSMSESLLAVGAPGAGDNGEVYLFESSGFAADWIEEGRIIPEGLIPNRCQAGVGAAVQKVTAAAGCPESAGDAYVFVHDASGIFSDGFESGDTTAWSASLL